MPAHQDKELYNLGNLAHGAFHCKLDGVPIPQGCTAPLTPGNQVQVHRGRPACPSLIPQALPANDILRPNPPRLPHYSVRVCT